MRGEAVEREVWRVVSDQGLLLQIPGPITDAQAQAIIAYMRQRDEEFEKERAAHADLKQRLRAAAESGVLDSKEILQHLDALNTLGVLLDRR